MSTELQAVRNKGRVRPRSYEEDRRLSCGLRGFVRTCGRRVGHFAYFAQLDLKDKPEENADDDDVMEIQEVAGEMDVQEEVDEIEVQPRAPLVEKEKVQASILSFFRKK